MAFHAAESRELGQSCGPQKRGRKVPGCTSHEGRTELFGKRHKLVHNHIPV